MGRQNGPGVRLLDADGPSLAAGVPDSPPGTLYVRSAAGGLVVDPAVRFTVLFGRDTTNVHVPVGLGDRHVSREHGRVTREDGRWVLTNHGRLPLQLPGPTLLLSDGSTPVSPGYTPIMVKHRHGPLHVIETYVVPRPGQGAEASETASTTLGKPYRLNSDERLALIVIAQRYLRHETYAQPVGWAQAGEDLVTVTGDSSWTAKRVERLVARVRERLHEKYGVKGLTREEVGEPVGNALNHNLITELLLSATLVPPDLKEIDVLDW
jgi:hypothetical protein